MSVSIEIECTPPRGGLMWFAPLQRTLRGRIDVRELVEADAAVLRAWPDPIPGQRVGLTAEGVGFVRDPLHDPGHAALKARIEALGLKLPPAREDFPDTHAPTWLYWLKQALDSGLARVTQGQLPDRIEGRPRKRFVAPEVDDPQEARIRRLEEQNRALVTILLANLPDGKRRAVEEALAGQGAP